MFCYIWYFITIITLEKGIIMKKELGKKLVSFLLTAMVTVITVLPITQNDYEGAYTSYSESDTIDRLKTDLPFEH